MVGVEKNVIDICFGKKGQIVKDTALWFKSHTLKQKLMRILPITSLEPKVTTIAL